MQELEKAVANTEIQDRRNKTALSLQGRVEGHGTE